MNHFLVPAAIAALAIGAIWSASGWALLNHAKSVSIRASQWVLWSGIGVLVIGVLLYICPVFLIFAARPA